MAARTYLSGAMRFFPVTIFSFLPLLLAGYLMQLPEAEMRSPTHSTRFDGPYVLHKNGRVQVTYIDDEHGVKRLRQEMVPSAEAGSLNLEVATDEPGKFFSVRLRSQIAPEKPEHPMPDKMFVVSDLEGNFAAFRKLLQAGGVIDASYRWTYGNGRLVLVGDFVDRGDQVTELLWLIYSLEDQARSQGGYVHYILGNHEIMNLSGDLRYLHPKYAQAAALMQTGFTQLYGEQSELGRWLRSKNVVEKIGDLLFVHAGISPSLNQLGLPVTRINKMMRPYYADSLQDFNSGQLAALFSDAGPFWYRGYYKSPDTHPATVDSTLSIYQVRHIATGHTVVADTISLHFQGKVINTDVHHAKGHTEALVVERGRYFRMNLSGVRVPLGL